MNEENPYRSPLAECGGTTTPASMVEGGAMWVALGLVAVSGAAVWRTVWFTLGYVTDPVVFAYAGAVLIMFGLCFMLVGSILRR